MRGEILAKIAGIAAADWDACLPSEVENHAYYVACENLSDLRIKMAAVRVLAGEQTIAVAPLIILDYRLDMSLRGGLRKITDRLAKILPKLLSLRALALGSPFAERCHIGVSAHLSLEQQQEVVRVLMQTVATHGRAIGASVVGIKDLAAPDEARFGAVLTQAGFARMGSLPVAITDLPFATLEDYLSSLSPNMRSAMRRKNRRRDGVRLEMRDDISGLESQIHALFLSTQAQSGEDYGDLEHVPHGYFSAVQRASQGKIIYALYWIGDTLAAFNQLLIEKNRVIDKYMGMLYPLAREHNLYYLRWMDAVSYCLEHKIGSLQDGQTAYREKLRLGARLVASGIWFRHRNPLVQALLRRISPLLAFDRADPALKGEDHAF